MLIAVSGRRAHAYIYAHHAQRDIFAACHLTWKYPLKGDLYVWSSYNAVQELRRLCSSLHTSVATLKCCNQYCLVGYFVWIVCVDAKGRGNRCTLEACLQRGWKSVMCVA